MSGLYRIQCYSFQNGLIEVIHFLKWFICIRLRDTWQQPQQQVLHWSRASAQINTGRHADPKEYVMAAHGPRLFSKPQYLLLCHAQKARPFHSRTTQQKQRAYHGMAAWGFCCPHSLQQRSRGPGRDKKQRRQMLLAKFLMDSERPNFTQGKC